MDGKERKEFIQGQAARHSAFCYEAFDSIKLKDSVGYEMYLSKAIEVENECIAAGFPGTAEGLIHNREINGIVSGGYHE